MQQVLSWRSVATKCCSKDECSGPSSYLAAQEGNYFQWRLNEHDEWEVENSHGHTIASSKIRNDKTCA